MAGNAERTYLMIKPDGVQRGLAGKIIARFEERGYKLVSRSGRGSRAARRGGGAARGALCSLVVARCRPYAYGARAAPRRSP